MSKYYRDVTEESSCEGLTLWLGSARNVILSVEKDLSSHCTRLSPALSRDPGACSSVLRDLGRAAQVSVAENAPSHRPEAVSLRESDMVF
jgi:hypothetical protein